MRHRDDDDGRGRYGGWDRRGREGWHRGRRSGGFGSSYDAWSQGAGYDPATEGLGPDERPVRGGFADEDWQPTRPARGRGAWAGDWENEEAARRDAREDHRGRGPRGYRRSDERIREEVCERLTDDWSVDASDLDIHVQDGDVTVSGTVATREQKRRAIACIEDVRDVRDVINRIRLRETRDAAHASGGNTFASDVAADKGRRP